MGSSWRSYPKIYNVGHSAVDAIFDDRVLIEEKVDGSQFSFGIYDGELRFRSKGREFSAEDADKMFRAGVDQVVAIAAKLVPGWMYSGEYLQKPKHNTLKYSRIPNGHIAIFDVRTAEEKYLNFVDKEREALRLGFDVVPALYVGRVTDPGFVRGLLGMESFLGGAEIEGVVIKAFYRFGSDGKLLMAKHVSEAFKESHKKAWKESNPGGGDVLQILAATYKHENRWKKAVQHLRDAGKLTGTPKDIGELVKEVPNDIRAECEQEIKDALFKWAWPAISRGAIRGLPEWYKNQLLESAFSDEEAA